jgi:hypothetical protein
VDADEKLAQVVGVSGLCHVPVNGSSEVVGKVANRQMGGGGIGDEGEEAAVLAFWHRKVDRSGLLQVGDGGPTSS